MGTPKEESREATPDNRGNLGDEEVAGPSIKSENDEEPQQGTSGEG